MLGSSQLPRTGDVVEKARMVGCHVCDRPLVNCENDGVVGFPRALLLLILKPWKALRNAEVLRVFIFADIEFSPSCLLMA